MVGNPQKSTPPQNTAFKIRKKEIKNPPTGKGKKDAKTVNKNAPEKKNLLLDPIIGKIFKKEIKLKNKTPSANNRVFSLIIFMLKVPSIFMAFAISKLLL